MRSSAVPQNKRQFVTILSVNKTTESKGMGTLYPFFFCKGDPMNRKARFTAYSSIIAALYVALTYFQNFLLPGSASWAVQFRVSEALCVLALFTPAAIPGLSLGCLLFNLSFAGALPLDFLVGTLASGLSAAGMYFTRRFTVKGYPHFSMLMPALFNALLVGWELDFYIGGGFWLNALYVAIGEAAVLLTLGSILFYTIKVRHLDSRLFG